MNIQVNFRQIVDSLLHLMYPNLCLGCERPLLSQEKKGICLHCLSNIEQTYQHHKPYPNDIEARFLGYQRLKGASALYYFDKEGSFQQLMYALKYENKPFLGVVLGEFLGTMLKEEGFLSQIDALVPVPMHLSKRRKRGYNQAEKIMQGIQKVANIPFYPKLLVKTYRTLTQTKKNRLERQTQVRSMFESAQPEILKGKNILLIDDIITTGSTLAQCMDVLEKYDCQSYKIATLGMAR